MPDNHMFGLGQWMYHILCPTTPEKASAFWTAIQGVGTAIAAIGAVVAAWYSVVTLRLQTKQLSIQTEQLQAQIDQVKIELWRSLSQEFDHDLAGARSLCGESYTSNKKADEKIFQPILDFFDTVGYLVRTKQINDKLTHSTFSYYLTGYFIVAEEFMRTAQKENSKFYSEVFFLINRWGKDRSLTSQEDLQEFFQTEQTRGETLDETP